MRNVIAAISASICQQQHGTVIKSGRNQGGLEMAGTGSAVQCSGSRCETPPSVSHSHSLFDRKLISRGEHCT